VTSAPLTRRQRIRRRLRRARRRFLETGSERALRVYLISKARLGRWDERYLLHFGVNGDVNRDIRRFFTRAFAAGLVPTSGRRNDPGSHHHNGNAGDAGLRRELVGTAEGATRLRRFHAAEYDRRGRTRPVELIGPINDRQVLGGVDAVLQEGAPLEDEHDNHVHFAHL
jgi:hypothetical protein